MVPPPRWGLGDAAAGYGVAVLTTIAAVSVWVAVTGDDGIGYSVAGLLGLWFGLVGAAVVVTRRKGSGSLAADFGLRIRGGDLGVGVVAGAVVQFALVPLVYLPLRSWIPDVDEQLSRPARELSGEAGSDAAFALLTVLVVVGAPLVEELFFRGLLQRALGRRFPAPVAVAGSAVAFGAVHYQPLQFPALVALGLVLGTLAHRAGRLGPAIAAHATFNAITMAYLVSVR
ncbi:MAG TPA: CPBP family intramembrane glutamic endopeptidase [Acidimicrobiales bacterium]|nr:CPBP family intramembrane glutamic endopeptidase [Acidimicrobiales bacterium]